MNEQRLIIIEDAISEYDVSELVSLGITKETNVRLCTLGANLHCKIP